MDEIINITNGDTFEVTHELGYPAIKIENRVWAEDPRYLAVSTAGRHDRERDIDALIAALERLKGERE